ncbi:hypothetical protein DBV39_11745 [Orrella marina]|uniref:M23ase beta-sheet core domain-containing protein n=1 Tax=Orrella marina TaxID=2163011 RepID=A0A2R4XKG2_9BURK|nr:hypothetical protein DBV39_11745 [Orrella marina]
MKLIQNVVSVCAVLAFIGISGPHVHASPALTEGPSTDAVPLFDNLESLDRQQIDHARSHQLDPLDGAEDLIAIWPVLGQSRLSSEFGKRRHPIRKAFIMHKGIDLAAPRGTPILAVSAGVVTFSGWRNGYGRIVEIRHPNGWTSVYAHAQRLMVKKGERVLQGQSIAQVGSTGDVTGPHLHFEIRKNNKPVNPLTLYPDGYAYVMQSL